MSEKKFITFDEALELHHSLGVPIGRTSLYRAVKESKEEGTPIPAKKINGRYLFDREELTKFIKEALAN